MQSGMNKIEWWCLYDWLWCEVGLMLMLKYWISFFILKSLLFLLAVFLCYI